jgi:hypothetical protein
MDIDDALDTLADLCSDSIADSLRSLLERLYPDDRRVWHPLFISEVGIDILVSAMLFAILASRDLWNDDMFKAILASNRDGLESAISEVELDGLTSEDLTLRYRHLMHMVNESQKLGRDLIYDDRIPVQIAEVTATWATRAFPPDISEVQRLRFCQRIAFHTYTQMLATAVVWREMCTGNQLYVADGESSEE